MKILIIAISILLEYTIAASAAEPITATPAKLGFTEIRNLANRIQLEMDDRGDL